MKNAILIILLILTTSASGAEMLVPSQYPTIQSAIDDANDGDTVIVAPGTYTGDGNRDIKFLGKAITVRSIDPNDPNIVAATIIDCNGTEVEPHRGFYFQTGEDANSVLDGFTIKNGYSDQGGGIRCYSSGPAITNCTINGNSALWGGGGIANCKGPISNCSVAGNSATWGGGFCDCWGLITNCVIVGNSANISGGGISMCGGSISNCLIKGNSANRGGGIDRYEGSISDCNIVGNSADYGGGLLMSHSDNGPISRCIISKNSAERIGGGICYLDRAGYVSPSILDCIITANSAYQGGGICSLVIDPNITNCTITSNIANFGGGIYCWDDSNATITNSILWDNFSLEYGHQIFVGGNGIASLSYTDIQGGSDDIYIEPNGTLNWLPGNIDTDPCFVEPGYWADVNDPNIIVEPNDPNAVWVHGDHHLKSAGWRWDSARQRWDWDDVTSPCIDAGNPGSPLADEPLSIPEDPNNVWGHNLRINMGAFGGTAEASIPPYDWALLSDITNDGISDFNDLRILSSLWLNTGQQLYADFDRDGDVDFSDFALLAQDWLLQTSWH